MFMDKCWFVIIKKKSAEDSTPQYSKKKPQKEQVKCDPFMKENLEMKSSFLNFLNSVTG